MKMRKLLSVIMACALVVMLFSANELKTGASSTVCGNDHADVYQNHIISQTGTKHTYCIYCPTCNIIFDGSVSGTYDTTVTEYHSDYNSQTITATNSSYHTYSGTCDICGTYSISEDHTFNDSGTGGTDDSGTGGFTDDNNSSTGGSTGDDGSSAGGSSGDDNSSSAAKSAMTLNASSLTVQKGKVTTKKLKLSKTKLNIKKGKSATVTVTATPNKLSTGEKITVKSNKKA